jgi:hypothetical protein
MQLHGKMVLADISNNNPVHAGARMRQRMIAHRLQTHMPPHIKLVMSDSSTNSAGHAGAHAAATVAVTFTESNTWQHMSCQHPAASIDSHTPSATSSKYCQTPVIVTGESTMLCMQVTTNVHIQTGTTSQGMACSCFASALHYIGNGHQHNKDQHSQYISVASHSAAAATNKDHPLPHLHQVPQVFAVARNLDCYVVQACQVTQLSDDRVCGDAKP